MSLHARFLALLIVLVVLGLGAISWYMPEQAKKDQLTHAAQTASDLRAILMAMRRVYQKQFLESGIPLNDHTLGFLPAHVMPRISREFGNWSDSGVHFNAVSDSPRNSANLANAVELGAMDWFRQNENEKERIILIEEPSDVPYYHYSQPIWIEAYCLECHGRKDEAPATISMRYDTGYDYQVGDLRGLMSIRIPVSTVARQATKKAVPYVLTTGLVVLLGALFIYLVLRRNVFLRLEKIVKGIRRIAEGRYEDGLDGGYHDELGQVCTALNEMSAQRASHEQELEEERNLYRTLSETNKLILRQSAPAQLFESICEIAVEYTDLVLAEIRVSAEPYEELELKAVRGPEDLIEAMELTSDTPEQTLHEPTASVLKTHEECVLQNYMDRKHALFTCIGSAAAFPLILNGKMTGVFSCFASQPGYFTERIVELLREMSSDLAFAVHNHQLERHLDATEGRLKYLTDYDELTGLANRDFLKEQLDQAIPRSRRYGFRGALLHLDLREFHLVNESLGQEAGNKLLRKVANDLNTRLRKEDALARVGVDEFLILLDQVGTDADQSATEALQTARNIQEVVNQKRLIAGETLRMDCSLGLVVFPTTGKQSADEIMLRATTALHQAKASEPGSIRMFQASMEATASQRLRLRHELRDAISSDQFELVYQPQVSAETASPTGVEALLRWHHPQGRVLEPASFIPQLEDGAQIIEVGRWVLDQGCAQLRRWIDAGHWPEANRLAVNLSAKQVMQDDCGATLNAITARHGVSPTMLELEITESVFLETTELNIGRLQELRDSGYSVSIDDFGTGYSSLAYLRHLPADVLKIDQSFIRDVAMFADAQTIVKTIINFAHSFEMRCIAEGVEHVSQHQILRELGVDQVQGFIYSRPLDADALGLWLKTQTRRRQLHSSSRWVKS